jgi:hypothetical protein
VRTSINFKYGKEYFTNFYRREWSVSTPPFFCAGTFVLCQKSEGEGQISAPPDNAVHIGHGRFVSQ